MSKRHIGIPAILLLGVIQAAFAGALVAADWPVRRYPAHLSVPGGTGRRW